MDIPAPRLGGPLQAEGAPMGRREALRRAAATLGGALSAPTVLAVLAGCRGASSSDKRVRMLTAEQLELLATMAEHIIPETDTPGARALGVHHFMEEVLSVYFSDAERRHFLGGLGELDERAASTFGMRFVEGSAEQRLELLEAVERELYSEPTDTASGASAQDLVDGSGVVIPPRAGGTPRWVHGSLRLRPAPLPFFRAVRELTVAGYYSSEVGATRELRHEPLPGRFQGCIPYEQVGRGWAVS